MSRITSVSALTIALGLMSAPLAFAQGGSPAGSTGGTAEIQPQATQAQPAAPTPARKARTASAKQAAAAKVDLNAATRDELERLPGIDDATADKIMAARPLKSKSELLAKGIMTKAEYAKISAHVVAKPVASK